MGSRNLSRYIFIAVCSVLLLSSAAQPAFSWGDDGHELVARIAARNLTAKARQGIVDLTRRASVDDLKLRDLVGKLNDPQPSDDAVEEALARIAIWPDHMPGGKGITQPWHFIDIGLFEGVAAILFYVVGRRIQLFRINRELRWSTQKIN